MKIIYIDWSGGTSTQALITALVNLSVERSLNESKYWNAIENIEDRDTTELPLTYIEQVMRSLECSKVVSSAIEIDGAADKDILSILKYGTVKLVTNKKCYYDLAAAAFAVKTQGDISGIQGKLLASSVGEANGTKVTCTLIDTESYFEEDSQYIIECNIDDMNSEGYDYIFNKLLERGALDVYVTPIIMKKGRPAVKLSTLCNVKNLDELEKTIFKETSTFGVRSYKVEKTMLSRSFSTIRVFDEEVRVKYGYMNGKVIKAKPEYEDCKAIAQKIGLGINTVYMEAIKKIPSIEMGDE